MKLQKLVYYAHGWSLALTNNSLINEQVEAWKFGPVIESIFHASKKYGNNNVSSYLKDIDIDFETLNWLENTPKVSANDEKYLEILDFVWNLYGIFSAFKLSNMTHKPGTPWHQIASEYAGDLPKNTDIPTKIIKQWFEEEAERLRKAHAE